MSDSKPAPILQATPFQKFTIRLVDGKFVRVPKTEPPAAAAPPEQAADSKQKDIREMYRLVNGRFTRLLKLELDTADPNDSTIGMTLPAALKKRKKAPPANGDAAAPKAEK